LDILVLTETWHHASDDISLRRATPPGYACVDAVRPDDPAHGGIVVLHKKQLAATKLRIPTSLTFESLCLRLATGGRSMILLSIYRPGSAHVTAQFFDELAAVLDQLIVHRCPIIIGGDFNIHVDNPADLNAARLADLLSSSDLVQHVSEPTHTLGHTLDLVITGSDLRVESVTVNPAGAISDHGLVRCIIPLAPLTTTSHARLVRSWRTVDREELRTAIEQSPLCEPSADLTATELFDIYHRTLTELADRFAPLHSVRSRFKPLTVWYDAECRALRRKCRCLERRYRRTGLDTDRVAWITELRLKHEKLTVKE
jgi:hypothetical protein